MNDFIDYINQFIAFSLRNVTEKTSKWSEFLTLIRLNIWRTSSSWVNKRKKYFTTTTTKNLTREIYFSSFLSKFLHKFNAYIRYRDVHETKSITKNKIFASILWYYRILKQHQRKWSYSSKFSRKNRKWIFETITRNLEIELTKNSKNWEKVYDVFNTAKDDEASEWSKRRKTKEIRDSM